MRLEKEGLGWGLSKLEQRISGVGSQLCVGVDVGKDLRRDMDWVQIKEVMEEYLEQTVSNAAAVKVQLSGWLVGGGEGIKQLKDLINDIKLSHPEVPILLDAKFSDVAVSLEHYAEFAFEHLGVDGVTANPLLGLDAAGELIKYEDKIIYFLANTSNLGARTFFGYPEEQPLYLKIVLEVEKWNRRGNLGLVVGGTDLGVAERIREVSDLPFLIPGVGAQGAEIEGVAKLLQKGSRDIVNVSRGLFESSNAGEAAFWFRKALKGKTLVEQLTESGCVKTGSFVLASGEESSIYIDLRRLSGKPELLFSVASKLLEKVANVEYEVIACIATGGVPLGVVMSQICSKPLVYIRKQKKGYGLGEQVEGGVELKNKRVLLVDDVISSGMSKIEAIELLIDKGALMSGIGVVVDRREERENLAGLEVISLCDLSDFC